MGEENKVLRAQLELTQVRQEIERRITEKEEEFDSTRKNFMKAIDNMQNALETESKGKAEALRMKKKLESDVTELEMSLEHANAANQETQKSIKRYHQQIREAQSKLEDEQRGKEVVRDQLIASERKANSVQNALEEARTLLEQADRSRRMTEQELSDTNEQLSELTCQNQSIAGAKRKLESEMQTLHGDLDEMGSEAHLSEDKAKKAMVDAARIADELRHEQDLALSFEKDRKLLECQVKDMQCKLRRLRRLPPSTLPSSGRPNPTWLKRRRGLTLMSKPLPSLGPRDVPHPWLRCKSKLIQDDQQSHVHKPS